MTKRNVTQKTCSTEGCTKIHKAQGFCASHYVTEKRRGNITKLPIRTHCSVIGCNRKHKSKGYCSLHVYRFGMTGNPLVAKYVTGEGKTAEERFWARVDKTNGEDVCWEWKGARMGGYGVATLWVSATRKLRRASQIAYYYATGIIPTLFILHSCDNPPCCNPKHLREGTPKENTQDMLGRNRQGCGKGMKLSEAAVMRIRKEREELGTSYSQLAKKHNTSPSTMSDIVKRRTWRHIP